MTAEATRDAIVDAAYAVIASDGMARLSMSEVARRAGVSRQTLYRHFPSRQELLTAVVLREHRSFQVRIQGAAARHRTLRGAVEAFAAEVLRTAREHPLFDRLLRTEPESLLPFLTGTGSTLLPEVEPVLVELITDRLPHLSPVRVERTADALGRLLISYAINPGAASVDELAEGLAGVIVDGLKDER
ncbi:MAG TPA: TetR family transcriptional regulator [Acidimicrobiales bacterium]|jgi:AcrR family transcriptional regulator